ncbi:related to TGF beta induced protein ig-h3 precursor [Phialocephala subalpina]|uniref:Related to TGF beta induced protein ig-h3 n=1 Tax=Phialocephala subalpina TaxID=576137 RepID=A0A1L7WNB0_9HELO|nr:related to TGF beta induced protein ig-h3 precursor [Phialocephala subalpina]
MRLKNLLPIALASLATAQNMSLAQALASQNATLSTLNSLLAGQPQLLKTLSSARNITLIAPSNTAFSNFLADPANKAAANDSNTLTQVLQYHVLSGTIAASAFTNTQQFIRTMLMGSSSNGTTNATTTLSTVTRGQVVGGMTTGNKVVIMSGLKQISTVQTANIMFTGGVMHIVDTVLTVPQPPSNSAVNSSLTSLAGALKSTNLLTAIDSLKDVTIFAPSNDAFAAISSDTSTLTTQQLAGILKYHVINGSVAYSSLITTSLANQSFPTLSGGSVNVRVEDSKVFVNSAQVTITDILVSNGVIHVLDNVLNPANTTALPIPMATSQPIAFADVSTSTSRLTASTAAPSVTASKAGAVRAIESGVGVAGMAALFGMVAVAGL